MLAPVVVLVSLASLASAAAAPRDVELAARELLPRFLPALLARQSSGIDPSTIPAQCKATCNTIVTTLNNPSCSTFSCLCTNANVNSLAGCFDCLLAISPTANLAAQAQSTVDQFTSACIGAGFNVPTPTIVASAPASGAVPPPTGGTTRSGGASTPGSVVQTPPGTASGIFFSSTSPPPADPTPTLTPITLPPRSSTSTPAPAPSAAPSTPISSGARTVGASVVLAGAAAAAVAALL